jgi:tetratricopeptide (TPR) repeat protein
VAAPCDVEYAGALVLSALLPVVAQLFQQSMNTNRKCGDDRGIAVSSNEMALVYESRGDYKRAEGLYRQAYELFLKLGHRHNGAILAFNVAGTVLQQGRLGEAEQLFLESQRLSREIGDKAAELGTYDGLAELAFLRGNLHQALWYSETSLAHKKDAAEKFEYIQAVLVLLDTLEAQGNLIEARKKAEEARKLAEEIGATQQLADLKMKIAEFDLEDGRAADAEAALRESLQIFLSEEAQDDEVEARCALSRSLLMQHKLSDAKGVLDEVREIADRRQNVVTKLHFKIADVRVRAALTEGRDADARLRAAAELQRTADEAKRRGLLPLQYEARLARAEVLVQSELPAGKTLANSLAKDAQNHGFELVARQAQASLR